MFVLAEVVCGASPVPYASLGNDEVRQKFHWKKLGRGQGSAYDRKSRFGVVWWRIFGVKFCVSVALRALSSSNSNCASDSQSLSRRVILHFARDLWNQRAKCDNIRPKLFGIFGRLFWHNSSFVCSFWLRLFVVRVLYHMQVWKHTR